VAHLDDQISVDDFVRGSSGQDTVLCHSPFLVGCPVH
jgi:hypothetical protein